MNQRSNAVLEVAYESRDAASVLAENGHVLAVFEFGSSPLAASDPRHVPIALPQLDELPQVEVWRAHGPVESGRLNHVRFVRGLDLSMGHIALDLREFSNVDEASQVAYQELQDFLGRSPHHWPLKIWNYIPGINLGDGDQERYRQFCVGRARALAAHYGDQPPMPAATAIGVNGDEPALQVYFLAGALPGLNVENPRQVNAWQYPRRYSPRSPLFSRGTIMEVGASRHFLISGTASVVGHETHHDNARDQVIESIRNVNSLIGEGGRLLAAPAMQLEGTGVMRVYIRHREDFTAIADELEGIVPNSIPRVHLHGDICRSDLLTEVDGILVCG
jgi:chorismate lyase/3-hydroxybenzoate synthase